MRQSARDLLASIEDGFARFELELGTRRMVLAERHQLFRLAEDYRRQRRAAVAPQGPPAWSGDPAWGKRHLMFIDGLAISNSLNADICLREHPLLSGVVGTDLSTGKITLKAPLPFDFWESFSFDMRPLTRGDVTSIQQFLQWLGLSTIDRTDSEAAIQRVARENAWRPQD